MIEAPSEKEVVEFAIEATSLGSLLVATTEQGICAIELGSDADTLEHKLRKDFPNACVRPAPPAFKPVSASVAQLIEEPWRPMSLALNLRGTPLEQRIWQLIQSIPAGTTSTYSQLAAQTGHDVQPQEVAQACAANRLAVAVPCHRVIRLDGSLAGYRWGVGRKRTLLQREAGWAARDGGFRLST